MRSKIMGICVVLLLLVLSPVALAADGSATTSNSKKPGKVIWMCRDNKTFLVGESYKQWQLTHGARMGKCDKPTSGNVIWMCKESRSFLVGVSYMQWQKDHGAKTGKCSA
ncbi:MAG TPA: hypothetical protein VJH88_03935 [Candidatus Nanoarchaeia archaeon]|nr:hypothetical protein [Candidatus Nanoarchaeia archaeon]